MSELIKLSFKNKKMYEREEHIYWLTSVQDILNKEFADAIHTACLDTMIFGLGTIVLSIDQDKDILNAKNVDLENVIDDF